MPVFEMMARRLVNSKRLSKVEFLQPLDSPGQAAVFLSSLSDDRLVDKAGQHLELEMNRSLFSRCTGFCLSLSMLVATLGCGSSVPQIGGVSGTTSAAGKGLPEGTILTFSAVGRDESFVTRVKADGTYAYTPPGGAKVIPGKYKVMITPPPQRVIEKDGVSMVDPTDKATYPEITAKYKSKESTPLEVEVGASATTFNIELEAAK